MQDFNRLKHGDWFVYGNGVFIKIYIPNGHENAVNIATGDVAYFTDKMQVLKIRKENY